MYRYSLFSIGLFFGLSLGVFAQQDKWKGFDRFHFRVAGHEAWYVRPAHPLEGHPWVWRASFPDWHTDMDSLLLVKGCYVVYVSVDNEYGSPRSMQVWDRCYAYVVDSVGLAGRVALEAVSRGALYSYGWAKRHPDRISCIYAETPVCDIKSWPGGKGRSPGDTAAWKQLLQVYGISEDSALRFDDNPKDQLAGLASFKVPILHVIGYRDELAPAEENSYPLAESYIKLGGPVAIYPVTTGPQELQGHHFPIEQPGKWADWILDNSYPVRNRLPYAPYLTIRQGLPHVFTRLTRSDPVTVAFLGGSITFNPGWRNKTMTWLRERYPQTAFQFISAGIPSLGSPAHAFRFSQDVLGPAAGHKVDLLFVEAAVNDRGNGTDSITQLRSLEGIVRFARRSNPSMDIVLLSFADPLKTADYHAGQQPAEVKNHETVAERYGLPSINLAKEIADRLAAKEFSWEYDFKDLHPSPFGQELYFATIEKLLATCWPIEENTIGGNAAAAHNNGGKSQPMPKLPAPLTSEPFDHGAYYPLVMAKTDASWVIDPDWTPADHLPVQQGFVHVPVLQATGAGAGLSLPFTGTAVGIAVNSGPDAGMISWSVDDGPEQTMDLSTPWSSARHLPWYLVLGQDMEKKRHVLQLKIVQREEKKDKGNSCRIVHFLVNE
jgi:sialidase-1